uniref:Splicing factor 3B subunit 3 n=2 Tax=Cacopsylla melanoneura TaxID=428564 RepID=A0A8D8RL10_9HEMI
MYLYNLTLQRASGITHAIHGNFSGSKTQEIVVSRGKSLEILKPDPNTGKVHTMLSIEVFGVIQSLIPFRLMNGSKDYIVVGSDSGRIVVLEYNPSKNVLEKVHQETFGKSGCRRIIPGQYLASDPLGRAVMVGAIEKQKLVYIFNRDDVQRLTISSPREGFKLNTLVYHIVAIDVKYENPMFACLEIDYEEADLDPTGEAVLKTHQTLTLYELNLVQNHIVRKHSEPLDEHATFLVSVPGGNDGPSGVLVCSENYLTYKNVGDQHDIRCPIPRRRNDLDDPERGMIFVCSATHKTKSMFFFLLQTEQGDLFKATLETDDDMVTEIKLKYFDTVPVAAALCVLKTGFLFVASEFGNHYLYQIAHLGDDDDEPEFSSAMPLEEGDTFFFAPRSLRNLVLVDEMQSLSPILDCKVADLAKEDTPQLYMTCGRGPRSTLRVLRHGLEVSEMAVSELPSNPNAVWTVKRRSDEEFDAYIVVSFSNATLVLSIGETVEEVSDSGFLGTTPTLSCSALGDESVVQVYPDGIRHISSSKRSDWKESGKKKIVKCAVNQRQIVIALQGGRLIYFEMHPETGDLRECAEKKEMESEVMCMALSNAPSGEQMSRFLAVGLADKTVRLISLAPQDCLTQKNMQGLPDLAESLVMIEMGASDPTAGGVGPSDEPSGPVTLGQLYLYVGLQNGALLRMVVDQTSAGLSDDRMRYLGSRPVKLFKIKCQGNEAVLAMSSRSWLSYYYQNRFHLTPLSYEMLEYASGFSSEQCPEGIVAISTNTLRILALETLGAVFNQVSYPVEYTPRKFIIHPDTQNLIIAETEHNAYTDDTKKQRRVQMAEEMQEAAEENEQELAREMAEAFLTEDLPEKIFGAPKAGPGMWASLVRVLDPRTGNTESVTRFDQNEAVFSMSLVKFSNRPDDLHLVLGVAKDLNLNPRVANGGILYTYKMTGNDVELLHKTSVDEVPYAMCPFQGALLVGVGRYLRLYDLGKKKLLRKCENKHLPNLIIKIESMGHRIYVSDVQESVFLVRYKRYENQLLIFADDTQPRWVTTSCVLDYNTVAAADKFGNVCIVRLPTQVSDEVDDDPTGNKSLWDRGVLNGAAHKTELIASFHLGEVCLSLQKATLIEGGSECLIYTTVSGTVGVLVPFTSHEDQDFFQHLEMHMRAENPPLCGREHIYFRSAYFPVKNVLDGDLCEQFNSIDLSKQKSISEDLDKTPSEVSKKLEDIRTRFAF